MKNKVLVFLPDGIGIRNFVFSRFASICNIKSDLIYWNNTGSKIVDYSSINLPKPKLNFQSDILKSAIKESELNLFSKKFKSNVYKTYLFYSKPIKLKQIIKSAYRFVITSSAKDENRIKYLRSRLARLESKTDYSKSCYLQLQKLTPNILFCTNQRPIVAVAPIQAAKKLNIPTVCFIYSWDNLPKSTLVVETDYYFVWSEYMREELKKYYPFVRDSQIRVTGTPQFEIHFDENLILSKQIFFQRYSLDLNKKYICFSGDDVTTSPYDQFYLRDAALAVRKLNEKGYNLGILYRKCPVDFTGRQDEVLFDFANEIVSVDPIWENLGNSWNRVMPKREDSELLANTVRYSEMVINVGSSMVFDFAAQNKPCAYLNYDTAEGMNGDWRIEKIYDYIHFASMPSKESVIWIDKIEDFERDIIKGLSGEFDLSEAHKWMNIISTYPHDKASQRIVQELENIS